MHLDIQAIPSGFCRRL